MLIAGAGSAGIETLGILRTNGYDGNIVFYDDKVKPENFKYGRLINDKSLLEEIFEIDPYLVVSIGNTRIRERMLDFLAHLGGQPKNIVSNRAVILSELSENATIIQPGAVISFGVNIGISGMIHANSIIGHKVTIGDYVSIGPSVTIVGPCVIGKHCFIGAGSTILPGTQIGNHVIVPAGSTVSGILADFHTFNNA